MTSAMASFDSSIPPRTHCSAATSCGGDRSKPPSSERPSTGRDSARGSTARVSSVIDTAPHPPQPSSPHDPLGYDKNPAAPRRTTVEPYGGCGGGTNASVDEPLDNLWTVGANRVRRAVHSLWTALGTTDAGESEQRKRFPHLVWTRKSHRRVASGLGTLDT